MSDLSIPPIDPRVLESSRKIRKRKKRENQIQWLKDHFFDICNLIIALIALVVAIAGLYLPKSDQPAQQEPDADAAYYDKGNL